MLVAPPDVDRGPRRERMESFAPIPREPLPFPSLLVASRNDSFASLHTAARIATMWGSTLVEVGRLGHINAESGIGEWSEGLQLMASLVTEERAEEPLWDWAANQENSDGDALTERR